MSDLSKHFSRGLAALSVFAVVACGGTATPSASPSAASPAASKPAASPSQAAAASASAKPAASAAASAAAKPAGSAAASSAAKPAASSAAKPAASGVSLDSLVAAAKQEGALSVGFSPTPQLNDTILPNFAKQYGLNVDKIQMNATQLANKMIQEKSAGVHSLERMLGPKIVVQWPAPNQGNPIVRVHGLSQL
jgi:hypothetical protein